MTHYITSVQRKHQYLISIQKTAIIFELCFSLGFAMKVSSSRELWLNQVHFNHPNLLEFAYMGSNQQWEHIRIVNEVLKCSLVEHWEIKLQSSLCSCILEWPSEPFQPCLLLVDTLVEYFALKAQSFCLFFSVLLCH